MLRIAGIVLIVAGLAGLAVGGFEYTRTKEVAKVGPLEVKAKEQQSVTIPPLAAGGTAAVGVALFLAGRKKQHEAKNRKVEKSRPARPDLPGGGR